MRKSFTYIYDIPKDDSSSWGGRVIGFNIDDARKLLRTILHVRALPKGTQVFRPIGEN